MEKMIKICPECNLFQNAINNTCTYCSFDLTNTPVKFSETMILEGIHKTDYILPINFPELDEKIYAGFWRRFGAFWLDFLITSPITFGLFYINNLSRLNALYSIIPVYIIFFIYYIYFVKLWGATPGKLITKVKIIKKRGVGVGWREAILRHIIQWVLGLLSTIIMIKALFSMTDTEFLSLGYMERNIRIMELSPWFKPFQWLTNIWVWSEFLVLLLNKRKRALHDYVAGTVVIRKKYEIFIEQYAEEVTRLRH